MELLQLENFLLEGAAKGFLASLVFLHLLELFLEVVVHRLELDVVLKKQKKSGRFVRAGRSRRRRGGWRSRGG